MFYNCRADEERIAVMAAIILSGNSRNFTVLMAVEKAEEMEKIVRKRSHDENE